MERIADAEAPDGEARIRRGAKVPKRYLDDETAAAELSDRRSAIIKAKFQSREQTNQSQHWVSCDDCQKWRRVGKVPKGKRWYCKANSDPQFNSCDIPQELTDDALEKEALTIKQKKVSNNEAKQKVDQQDEADTVEQQRRREDEIIRQMDEAKRVRMEQEKMREQQHRDEERARQHKERARRQHEVWVNGKRKCRHCDEDAVKGNYGLCATHGAASRLKRRATSAPPKPIDAATQPADSQLQQVVQSAAQASQQALLQQIVPAQQQPGQAITMTDWRAEKLERERQRARERRANASEETKELERQRARDRRACASEEARARERERKKRKRDEAKLAAALVGIAQTDPSL